MMRSFSLVLGMAAGMAVATAAILTAYPDVSRRMVRAGRKTVRTARKSLCGILG